MDLYINMALLTLLAAVTVAIVVQRNMIGVVILAGVYSFLMASVMMVLDAPDVAMTEASVGAGVSTVFLLATLYITKTTDLGKTKGQGWALAISAVVTVVLVYATFTLPDYGLATAPVHTHVGPHYITQSIPETTIPNVVASVLGAYRSFDTLGETVVVFAAALGVILLLRSRRRSVGKPTRGGDT
ncbi:MAG: DUF4040 domain-containing protein [Hyphomicrobiaceae bacterium]